MRYARAALFVLIAAAACGLDAAAQSKWTGKYEFSEDGGKTAGGTAIFVTHELEIIDNGDSLVAMLQSNGYMTSRDLIGTAMVEGGKLHIYFDSYGENNVLEPYRKGDLLLTLEVVKGKHADSILTHWGKFEPVIPRNERSGRSYFRRASAPQHER